jgi:hypothetical protein
MRTGDDNNGTGAILVAKVHSTLSFTGYPSSQRFDQGTSHLASMQANSYQYETTNHTYQVQRTVRYQGQEA